MEMPSTWSGYRSCPHSLSLDSKGQFWVSASLGKMGRLGGGGLDIVMEPPICQTLYVTLLKYLRAATFDNQFSVIFNSTPKITKHREYNIWTSLVSN